MRAEDAQGTPTQSHISPSILVYEDQHRILTAPFTAKGGVAEPDGECTARVPPLVPYRGTSLIRNSASLGPYSSPMPRNLW